MKNKFIMISGWLPITQSSYESLQGFYSEDIIYKVLKMIADMMNDGESRDKIFEAVNKGLENVDEVDLFIHKAIDLIGDFYEIHNYYKNEFYWEGEEGL